MNPAQSSRLAKERRPADYCPKCLWNVRRSGPCQKHGTSAPTVHALAGQVYDGLKYAAECFGGIGYGLLFEDENREASKPLDVWGLTAWAMKDPGAERASLSAVQPALREAGLLTHECGITAVQRIIARRGIPNGPDDPFPRVSFEDYCAEVGLVRGEDDPRYNLFKSQEIPSYA